MSFPRYYARLRLLVLGHFPLLRLKAQRKQRDIVFAAGDLIHAHYDVVQDILCALVATNAHRFAIAKIETPRAHEPFAHV